MTSHSRAGRVSREPETARLAVAQVGFTRDRSFVAYGIELVNDSYDFDAVGVTLRWRFLDKADRVLARHAIDLAAVPAGTTFYIGGMTHIPRRADAIHFSATATFRESLKRRVVLPVAADITLERNGRRLTGQLINGTPRALSNEATIYAVLFDGKGRIIGGGAEPVTSRLPAGESAPFAIDNLSPIPARRALFAGVSIAP